MKLFRTFAVILFCLLLLAGKISQKTVSMQPLVVDRPYKAYLPNVGRTVRPERLGPYGAKVTTVVFHPENPNIVYAGTWGNGIYKSVDSGITWAPSSTGLGNLVIQSLAISPSRPNALYAGVYYQENGANGVYKSINSGASWIQTGRMQNMYADQMIERPIVYSLAIHPWDSDIVYAGTRMSILVPGEPIYGGGGVFKTVDGGLSWSTVNSGLPADDLYVYDLAIDPLQPNRVFAAMHESGVYKTDSGGSDWECINANIPHDPFADVISSGRSVVVDPSNPKRLYYGTYHRQGIFSTTNGGIRWFLDGLEGLKIVYLSIDPSDPKTVYATTNVNGVFITTNQGDTWGSVRPNGPGHTRMAVNPFDGRSLLVGTDSEGIFRSSDRGDTWSASYDGVSGYPINTVVIDSTNPQILYAAVFGKGVYKSYDRGKSWEGSSIGIGDLAITDLVIHPTSPQILYAATAGSGVYVSTDGAGSWTPLTSGYPIISGEISRSTNDRLFPVPEREPWEDAEGKLLGQVQPESVFAYALALGISPSQPSTVLLGTAGKGIVRLSSGTWTTTNISIGSVFSFYYDPANASIIYAGGGADVGGLLKTTDGGITWVYANTGLAGRTIYDLVKTSSGELFAGTDLGVYKSTDSGASWHVDALQNEPVLALYSPPNYAGTIYAGTVHSAYVRRGNGMSWGQVALELDHTYILDIIGDPGQKDFYYFSTRLGGIYRINSVP